MPTPKKKQPKQQPLTPAEQGRLAYLANPVKLDPEQVARIVGVARARRVNRPPAPDA